MKKIVVLILISMITILPVSAKDVVRAQARMTTEYSLLGEESPLIVKFMPGREVNFGRGVIVKSKSIITAEVYQSQKERRWHKSGFIICKLLSYVGPDSEEEIDISQRDIYMVARKHEPIDPKEAAILGTELTATTIGSVFVPGVDIAYFFTKGAILREKHPNWFRAGVSNAYDNSICWFWLKGKPIELQSGDEIKLVSIQKTKAKKIKANADKKNAKAKIKTAKKEAKQVAKMAKAEEKAKAKEAKAQAKMEKKEAKKAAKSKKQDN